MVLFADSHFRQVDIDGAATAFDATVDQPQNGNHRDHDAHDDAG